MKKTIQRALETNDLYEIIVLAKQQRRVLNLLVRFAYDKNTLSAWRAIMAVGLVAKALVETEHAFLREMTRKLFWSLSDESGGIGWSAPELLGEIVSADPARFSDLIPIIASHYDMEEVTFRPGVLYALGRIAGVSPERVMPVREVVMRGLSDENPLTRVYALEAVKALKGQWPPEELEDLKSALEELCTDRKQVWIYRGKDFAGVEVGEAAQESLKSLKE